MPINLKLSAYFKLKSLHDLVLSLRPHALHSASSRLLWDVVCETTEHLIETLGGLDSANILEAALIQRYGEIGDNLHFYLSFLEAGEASRIPSVMISPLQSMIYREAPGAKVVVWSSWLPSNYSSGPTISARLRSLVIEVFGDPAHRVVKKLPDVLAVLSFPAAERDNVLLHSALGHELGHVLLVDNNDIDGYIAYALAKKQPAKLNDKEIEAEAEQAANGSTKKGPPGGTLNLFMQKQYERLRASAMLTLSKWLMELIADAYAVYFLGPAPVLSLDYLAGMPAASQTHPPGYLRFKVMLECLNLSDFRKRDDPELDWLVRRLDEIEGACKTEPTFATPEFRLAFSLLKDHINLLARYVMGEPKGVDKSLASPYTYQDWAKLYTTEPSTFGTANSLVSRALNYVIPDLVDVGTPHTADLPSILNSGWAIFYKHWDDFCKGLDAVDLAGQYRARQKLFNLLLKAVESADLQQRWERKK